MNNTKRVFVILLCALTVILSACAAKPGAGLVMLHKGTKDVSLIEDIITSETGLDLPDDVQVVTQYDDFDNEGTGTALCTVDFSKSALATQMDLQFTIVQNWKTGEAPEYLKSSITDICTASEIAEPNFDGAYYYEKYNCWAQASELIVYDKETAEDIEIITYSLWDKSNMTLYYYCTTVIE